MRLVKTLLWALLLLVSSTAFARPPVPVVKVADQTIVTNSQKLPDENQVRDAIVAALEIRHWTLISNQPGNIIASLTWNNNKHTIVVNISYSTEKYSIHYKDSTNMRYGVVGDAQFIHPFYNDHVRNLNDSIRIMLLKY